MKKKSLDYFFYSGDGTGVGKGRQIAAIIADNFMKKRRKAIWFTVSHTLYMVFNFASSIFPFVILFLQDARRDLDDIGCGDKGKNYIPLLRVPDGNEKIPFEGVLFATYSKLVSKGTKRSLTRYDQIL